MRQPACLTFVLVTACAVSVEPPSPRPSSSQSQSLLSPPYCSSCSAYIASPFERKWTDTSARGRICELSARQVGGALEWLEYAATARGGTPIASPTHAQSEVLSRFIVHSGDTDGGRRGAGAGGQVVEYIEPLTGMARHPLSGITNCIGKYALPEKPDNLKKAYHRVGGGRPGHGEHGASILNTSYLIPANRCVGMKKFGGEIDGKAPRRTSTPTRNYFFDLGCSSRVVSSPPSPPSPPPPPVDVAQLRQSERERAVRIKTEGEAYFRTTGKCDIKVKYKTLSKARDAYALRRACVWASKKGHEARGNSSATRLSTRQAKILGRRAEESRAAARAVRDGELQQDGSGNEPGIAVPSLGLFTDMCTFMPYELSALSACSLHSLAQGTSNVYDVDFDSFSRVMQVRAQLHPFR